MSQTSRLLSLCALGALALAPEASAYTWSTSTSPGAGWVWAGGSVGGAPPSSYSYNSKGGANTVVRIGVGSYRVELAGLADRGGNVQVVAYGSGSERCKVSNWYSSATTLNVNVLCFTAAGAPVDTLFVAFYARETAAVPTAVYGAYLWAHDAASTDSTPEPEYQWNSTGTLGRVHRDSAGAYTVTLPGQYVTGGSVQVTSYGVGTQHCKVASWYVDGSDTRIAVRCFTPAGAPSDSMFSLLYHRGSPKLDMVGGYAWANDPVSAQYVPSETYQQNYNPNYPYGGRVYNTAGRYGTGSAFVEYPKLRGFTSTALVTAYGYGAESCKVGAWAPSADGGGTRVSVRCFDAAGNPKDTLFNSAYLNNDSFIPG
jgi:hypothetical protein